MGISQSNMMIMMMRNGFQVGWGRRRRWLRIEKSVFVSAFQVWILLKLLFL